jgi:hypothetical protein
VVLKKVAAYGDPRLYAVAVLADRLANSAQPLVPERMFVSGGGGGGDGANAGGPLGTLLSLLLSEKAGLGSFTETAEAKELKEQTEAMTREAVAGMRGE